MKMGCAVVQFVRTTNMITAEWVWPEVEDDECGRENAEGLK